MVVRIAEVALELPDQVDEGNGSATPPAPGRPGVRSEPDPVRSVGALFPTGGKQIATSDAALLVRTLPLGKRAPRHAGLRRRRHWLAASIPGNLVSLVAGGGSGNGQSQSMRFGHPSGTLRVGGKAAQEENGE